MWGFKRIGKAAKDLGWDEEVVEVILERGSEALFVVDSKNRLRTINSKAVSLTGYSLDELRARPFSKVVRNQDWPGVKAQLEFTRKGSDSPSPAYTVFAGKNGEETSVLLGTTALRKNGKAGEVLCIVQDVSERQTANQVINKFSSAVEKAADMVVITNREGIIEYVNRSFEKVTGYCADEVVGRTPRILKSGKHGPGLYRHMWATLLSGNTFDHLWVNRRKNGEFFYEEQTISPIRDELGRVTHFVSTGRDVTVRKQHEREQEAIVALSAALRKARTRSQLVKTALDQVCHLLQMDGAALTECQTDSDVNVFAAGAGSWAGVTEESRRVLQEISEHVLDTRYPYNAEDVRSDRRFRAQGGIEGIKSVAAIPLIAQEQPIGTLWAGSHEPVEEFELQMLIALGDLIANALYRSSLHEQTQARLERLTALHAIDLTITSGAELRVSLEILLGHLVSQLGADAGAVLLLNPETRSLDYAHGRGFRGSEIQGFRLSIGQGHVGKAVLQRRIISVLDIAEEGPELVRNPPLLEEGFQSYFAAPLIAKEQVKGVLEVFTRRKISPNGEWHSFLEAVSTQAALAIDNSNMFEDLKRSHRELAWAYDATIEGWARALELRDQETQGHAVRVAEITLHVARASGIPDFQMVHVRRGALLHDVGKLGIPDSILLKPGPLTCNEWDIMRMHPKYARNMLSPVDYLRPAIDIPLYHHERWDGKGYPQGIRGPQIPKAARVFAVVDVWDALRSDRPYRKAWEDSRILEHIRGLKESHFDPNVVEIFCEEFESIKKLATPLNGNHNNGHHKSRVS